MHVDQVLGLGRHDITPGDIISDLETLGFAPAPKKLREGGQRKNERLLG